jgi:hypothetical protein
MPAGPAGNEFKRHAQDGPSLTSCYREVPVYARGKEKGSLGSCPGAGRREDNKRKGGRGRGKGRSQQPEETQGQGKRKQC